MSSKEFKARDRLRKAMEHSLFALARGESSASSSSSKELKSLGKIMSQKDPATKQKRPDQKSYTVLKGKKQMEEDYIQSQSNKKHEPSKKEVQVKKSKRTPVDISALPTAPSASSTSSGPLLHPNARPTPVMPVRTPMANPWNERTGADLFANPSRSRLYEGTGLDPDDELALVLAESMRSAEQEDRFRTMYFEQHAAAQVLEQQPKFSHEAPTKELPFSSRNNGSIFFDDEIPDVQFDNKEPEVFPVYDSDDDWEVVKKGTIKTNHSLVDHTQKSRKSEVKKKLTKEDKPRKKEKEPQVHSELSIQFVKKEKEEKVPKSTGAIRKTRRETKIEGGVAEVEVDLVGKPESVTGSTEKRKKKSKTKKEPDFASIVEAKLSGPDYPPAQPLRAKKTAASSHKSRSTVSMETKLHNFGIDNDFDCEPEGEFDFQPTVNQTYQLDQATSEDTISPVPYAPENENENESDSESENSCDSAQPVACNDEDNEQYYSEIETEDYDFYPETVHVTLESHPEFFDPNNFANYSINSPDDEFFSLIRNLPSPILRHSSKHQGATPRPKIAVGKFKDILQTVQSDLKNNGGSSVVHRQSNTCKEDHSSNDANVNEPAALPSCSNEPRRRPRLPGTGRVKIPSSSETLSDKHILDSRDSNHATDVLPSAPTHVGLEPDLNDLSKFPSENPIYEGNSALTAPASSNPDSSRAQTCSQGAIQALMTGLSEETLVKALTHEISKLDISLDSPNLEEIQESVMKLLQDPESSFSKLIGEQMSKVSSGPSVSDIPNQPITSVTALPGSNVLPEDDNIKPLPFSLAATDSLFGTENISALPNSRYYENAVLQMNAQLSINTNSKIPGGPFRGSPFDQMALMSDGNIFSPALVNQTSGIYSCQPPLPEAPGNSTNPLGALPSEISCENSDLKHSSRVSTPSRPMSEDLIRNILEQTLETQEGVAGTALLANPDFRNHLPELVKIIQSQARNYPNQELFVQSFARDLHQNFLSSTTLPGCFSNQNQPPPGFSAQNQQNTGVSYSHLQHYSNPYQCTGVPMPNPFEPLYVGGSMQGNGSSGYYPPGFTMSNTVQSHSQTNINT